MTKIAPFRAVRPSKDKVHLVASRSYVMYSRNDLYRKLSENPFTFIHIINPEFGAPVKTKPNTKERFLKVKEKYEDFLKNEFLVPDLTPAVFIYRQITLERTFTGIVCGVSIDEYENGNIKIHEHTITEREEVFCRYLDICDFNAEPVLLTCRDELPILQNKIKSITSSEPEFDYSTTDRVRHQLWIVDNPKDQATIAAEYSKVGNLYIADGHHRTASSVKLGKRRNSQMAYDVLPDKMPHNFVLSMIIPSNELMILPFHRLIELDAPYESNKLLKNLAVDFDIIKSGEQVLPDKNGEFGLRINEGWYRLILKKKIKVVDPTKRLDTSLLTQYILQPQFHILDPKTDKRMSYIPGNEPLKPYEQRITKQKNLILFSLKAVTPDELFAVADAGGIMPPKSTWIAPKLRSGLTIMPLS